MDCERCASDRLPHQYTVKEAQEHHLRRILCERFGAAHRAPRRQLAQA